MSINSRSILTGLLAGVAALTFTTLSAQQPDGTAGKAMMGQHQKMMAQMEASQKTLDGLVAKMNAATGDAKVEQIAAVITEMAAQHRQMHQHMMMMHGSMAPATGATGQPGAPAAGAGAGEHNHK
jgi:hypothetical protein